MAKTRPGSKRDGGTNGDQLRPRESAQSGQELLRKAMATGTTGRYIVIYQRGASKAGAKLLHDKAGVPAGMASTADAPSGALDAAEVGDENLHFDKLDMAVVDLDPEQAVAASAAAADGPVQLIIPESFKFAASLGQVPLTPGTAPGQPGIAWPAPAWPAPAWPGPGGPFGVPGEYSPLWPAGSWTPDYLRGYLDGVLRLILGSGVAAPLATPALPAPFFPVPAAQLTAARAPLSDFLQRPGPFTLGTAGVPFVTAGDGGFDEAQMGHTWGLEVTQVVGSDFSGRGVKVAVLDTGLDLNHPDFAGRAITAHSFVPGESPQDVQGHGTHTTGTACGPKDPGVAPRYGIAYDAEIYVGKVLNNAKGSGLDSWILAGINWAITQGCRVINMSLEGLPTSNNTAYELAAKAALATTAIIAAAGNDSRRDLGIFRPVGVPANCLSIMAVASINARLQVSFFSNRGSIGGGGAIDVAGPGEDVYSSWPMPTRNKRESGTSMATPHVVGIAALVAEAKPHFTGAGILNALRNLAKDAGVLEGLSEQDVGQGLIVAP